MDTDKQTPVPCPTCGTLCNISWARLDLVANTGDETLATKCYTPDGGLYEMYQEAQKEIAELKNENIILKLANEGGQSGWNEKAANRRISTLEGLLREARNHIPTWPEDYDGRPSLELKKETDQLRDRITAALSGDKQPPPTSGSEATPKDETI